MDVAHFSDRKQFLYGTFKIYNDCSMWHWRYHICYFLLVILSPQLRYPVSIVIKSIFIARAPSAMCHVARFLVFQSLGMKNVLRATQLFFSQQLIKFIPISVFLFPPISHGPMLDGFASFRRRCPLLSVRHIRISLCGRGRRMPLPFPSTS